MYPACISFDEWHTANGFSYDFLSENDRIKKSDGKRRVHFIQIMYILRMEIEKGFPFLRVTNGKQAEMTIEFCHSRSLF